MDTIDDKILGIIAIFVIVTAAQGFGILTTSLAHVGDMTLSTGIGATRAGSGEGAGNFHDHSGSSSNGGHPPTQAPQTPQYAPRLIPG
jgi:hypothetical protein